MLGVPVIGWVISFLIAAVLAVLQYYKWVKESGGVKSPWLLAMLFRFFAWMALLALPTLGAGGSTRDDDPKPSITIYASGAADAGKCRSHRARDGETGYS